MAVDSRQKFQGVTNIIRFNWPFYLLSVLIPPALIILAGKVGGAMGIILFAGAFLAIVLTVASLGVSLYVYDLSGLYSFKWMEQLDTGPTLQVINIHAGFDESSSTISSRFPKAALTVFDFYDEKIHTEPSVRRARKLYPTFPGTVKVTTDTLPLHPHSSGLIFLLFAAHEIRNRNERIRFLSVLRNRLSETGRIVVVEHLRDLPNFLAYSIGFFHFYSRKEWLLSFEWSLLSIESEERLNPFVTKFILKAI